MVCGFIQNVEVGAGRQNPGRWEVTGAGRKGTLIRRQDNHFPLGKSGKGEGKALEKEASPGHGHLSKGHTALLAPRQAGNRAHGQFSRDAIPAQLVTVFLLRPSWNRPHPTVWVLGPTPSLHIPPSPTPNAYVLTPSVGGLLSNPR